MEPKRRMHPVVIPRENDRDLVIDLVLLAHESSHENRGARSLRWSEIIIGKTEAGAYLGAEIGKSVVRGEVDLSRHIITSDPFDIVRMLERAKRNRPGAPPTLTLLAIDALAAAASEDPVFAAAIGDALELQRLSAEDLAVAEQGLPEWAAHVEVVDEIEHGAPVISGTEVLVQTVLAELGNGTSPAATAASLRIGLADVLACCAYAAEVFRSNRAALTLRWRSTGRGS